MAPGCPFIIKHLSPIDFLGSIDYNHVGFVIGPHPFMRRSISLRVLLHSGGVGCLWTLRQFCASVFHGECPLFKDTTSHIYGHDLVLDS